MRKLETETFSTFICQYSGAPRNTALTLRFFCCCLTLVNASLEGVSCLPWSLSGWAGPLKDRGCQPIQWDSLPYQPGLGSTPKMGAVLLPLGGEVLLLLTVPVRRRPWRKDSMECPEVGSSSLPWPEVHGQWSFLWMLHSRHEPYGQQYPGQGPPSGQPSYGGHQPGLYPQQTVSWQAACISV